MSGTESIVKTATAAERPASHGRLETRLRRNLRGQVLFDRLSRGRYATDASIYQVSPVGVVVPADEADVIAAIDLAREMSVPILPRGAGTSQCGQTVGEALVIDNSRHLNELISVDPARMTAEVQPGMVLDALNARLKPHGLWFPVDVSTSAQATLGGMAGNNSCGSRSIAYGNMVHNVLGIDAILSDGTREFFGPFGPSASRPLSSARSSALVSRLFEIGERERSEIARMFPQVLRRVGGYNLDVFNPQSPRPYTSDGSVNLSHLLVGSEGTLAYFRRLHLKLSRLPAHRVLGVVNFPTFHQAMDSAQHIVRLRPSAVELVDRTMIDLSRQNPVFRPTIDRALVDVAGVAPQAILLVEFAGDDRTGLLAQLRGLVELMSDLGLPKSVVEMPDEPAQKALWEVRKAGLNIMMSLRGDGKPVSFIEDCAVPLEHLAEYTARLTEVFERHGTRGTWYAHASVGTLHVRPILDMRRDGAQRMRAIAEEAGELVRRYKGAFSGEHGDGLVRSEWVAWQFGPRLQAAFEAVKDLFDPSGLMNPGKIVRSTRMDESRLFRFKPDYRVIELKTALDWSAWNVQNDPRTETITAPGSGGDPAGGFAKAVEMCNNNGHCRKFDAGTMCPSYRVTRDEQHLTRGRANSLRLALSGQLGEGGLGQAALYETMDLCVSCKGCRRDCPTGVDMARMKIEFLHQYHQVHQRGLLERMVADLPKRAPWLSRFAGLVNGLGRWPVTGTLIRRVLGIAPGRSLPVWSNRSFLDTVVAARGAIRPAPEPLPANAAPAGGVPISVVPPAVLNPAVASAAGRTDESAASVREVVLWIDTFNNYFDPKIPMAAQRVLEAAGYRVHLPQADAAARREVLCCGRTSLASGQVEEARKLASRLLEVLQPFVERGVPIVGLEPSCLLGLRDEFLVMGLGPAAERLARASFLFEEFLVRERAQGRMALNLRPLGVANAWVHGHCHQKSFGVFSPVLEVLRWIPELTVNPIESSCCGMAGSFGFAEQHWTVSMQMAEASLLPAVRSAGAEDLIVADGTSCRHQILDGASRQALHVAEVLARALPAS